MQFCFFLGPKVTLKGVVERALTRAIAEALQPLIERELDRHLRSRSQRLGGLARHTIAQEVAEEIAGIFAEVIAHNIPRRLRGRLSRIAHENMQDFVASRGFRAMMRNFLRCSECLGDSSSSDEDSNSAYFGFSCVTRCVSVCFICVFFCGNCVLFLFQMCEILDSEQVVRGEFV